MITLFAILISSLTFAVNMIGNRPPIKREPLYKVPPAKKIQAPKPRPKTPDKVIPKKVWFSN